MKIKFFGIISVILSFTFILSVGIFPSNAAALNESKDDNIFACAEELKNEYINSALIQAQPMDADCETRNYEATIYYNQIIEHIDTYNDELRSHFSGAKINDKGYLVISLCCETDFCENYIKENFDFQNIIFEKGKGSYYYGQQKLNEINKKIASLQEEKVNGKNINADEKEMMELYPCTKYNDEDNTITIIFSVSEETEKAIEKSIKDKNGKLACDSKAQYSQSEISEIKKYNNAVDTFKSSILNEPDISYCTNSKSEYIIEDQAATEPWRPGRKIMVYNNPNEGTGSQLSTGYRAKYKDNGVIYYGFVTCGHGTSVGNSVYMENDTDPAHKLGVILARSYENTIDVSFIRMTNSGYSNGNAIYYTSSQPGVTRPGTVLDGTQATASLNSQIYKSGQTTYLTIGYVNSTSFAAYSGNVYFYDMLLSDRIMGGSGDSGAVTYITNTGTVSGKAVGIYKGNTSNKSVFIKASNIKASFGAEAY